MPPEEIGCPAFCMVVDAGGKAVGNVGVLRFPHPPAVGSKVFARRPPGRDDHPEDDGCREYVVLRCVYEFDAPQGTQATALSGWEVELEEVGFANPITEARVKGLA